MSKSDINKCCGEDKYILGGCCCLPCNHIVAIGPGLLKKFWPVAVLLIKIRSRILLVQIQKFEYSPKSLDQIETYNIKWVKSSWTDSMDPV